jgi:Flp pilus assembly protein TadG
MRSRSADERGSVTAELAAALPSVVLVLVLAIGGTQALASRAVLTGLAGEAARALAHGDPETSIAERVRREGQGAALTTAREAGLVCVRLDSVRRFAGIEVPLAARSCAAEGGW